MKIKKRKYFFIRNLALLFIVCNMVGWIFPFPYLVWRLALVMLSLYVIIFEEGKRLPCEKSVLIFATFNLIYYFIGLLWINPSTTQIGNILFALLPLSLFTCMSEKGVMTDKFFAVAVVVLLIGSVLRYYYLKDALIVIHDLDKESDITNNASVAFLMLLPMLFLLKNNIQRWASLLVCILFLVMGAKRGNLLAAVIPLVLFVYYVLKNNRRSVIKTIGILIIIIGIAFITYRWIVNNEYLMYRIEQTEEGNSSGRDVIYANTWHAWFDEDNIVHLAFGFGFDGTVHHPLIKGSRAHQDWLEILVDYGLLGAILYLAVFVTLIVQIVKINSNRLKLVLISSLCIWFLKSLYSMGFTDEALSLLMISMGTAWGYYKKPQIKIKK